MISRLFNFDYNPNAIEDYTYSPSFGNYSYWSCGYVANLQGWSFYGNHFPSNLYTFIYNLDLIYLCALGETIHPLTGVEETKQDCKYPYFWNHIEQGNTRIQGIGMCRISADLGDNVKIIKRNNVEYKSKILTGVGIADEANLLGIVYLPMTDRLNT